MFSGGSYDDVSRWLRNFVTAHAKRMDPRMEIVMEAGGDLEGRGYRARVRFGERLSETLTFDYREVADNRGTLAWCAALAARVHELALSLLAASGSPPNVRAR
jgi:hypothetical protein